MATTQLSIPEGPFFVSPFRGDSGGVDYLGLRQVNLDMMADCIPGINNVTRFIRPFSLNAWIYWKVHELAKREEIEELPTDSLRSFKEKAETLFTWAHQLEDPYASLPGSSSKPPQPEGPTPLSFDDWGRSTTNTSFMAAVTYGPASKTIGGLGFLDPMGGSAFAATAQGDNLAQAFDISLRASNQYGLLDSLDSDGATASQATQLYGALSVRHPTADEQKFFREAFFQKAEIGGNTLLGRRSETVALIQKILAESKNPLTEDEVRRCMAFRTTLDGKLIELSDALERASLKWLILQIRQLQRLSFEAIQSWLENKIIYGKRTTSEIIQDALKELSEAGDINGDIRLSKITKSYSARYASLNELRRHSDDGDDLFERLYATEALSPDHSEDTFAHAFQNLLFCSNAARLLSSISDVADRLRWGEAPRISLDHWMKSIERCADMSINRFISFFLENFIISQHFATAAARYDGQAQRMRYTIEDYGLDALVDHSWHPNISQDRLQTCLWLMADCGLIDSTAERTTFSV